MTKSGAQSVAPAELMSNARKKSSTLYVPGDRTKHANFVNS